MLNQQIATLNLTQSLRDFETTVKPLLELGEVEQWDGRTFRDRERKIREAALILAGQCIALLLFQLSQWQKAQERAIEQTRGWWRKKTGRNGSTERTILTVGNVSVTLNLVYVVERLGKPRKRKKSRNQGFCPLLRWLGMEQGITPFVWATVAEYGAMRTSFNTAYLTLKDWGIDISVKRIQRLTYRFCQTGLSGRQSKVFHLQQGDLPSTEVLKGQRVVISVDGGRTRLIFYQRGKPNPKTNRRKYKGEWKEPKLLTIYAVNDQGEKIKKGEIPITNDGTFGDSKELLKILEMYLVSLGIEQASEVLLLADGADWIWKNIPPLLERKGCPRSTTYYLQDFYHLTNF